MYATFQCASSDLGISAVVFETLFETKIGLDQSEPPGTLLNRPPFVCRCGVSVPRCPCLIVGLTLADGTWAFLANLDPRTAVVWRIARRLAAREFLHADGGCGDAATISASWGGRLWGVFCDGAGCDGDLLGVLAEVVGVGRMELVEETSRLLSLETLRLAIGNGDAHRQRRAVLRSMSAALGGERWQLRAWRREVRSMRQSRQLAAEKKASPQQTAEKVIAQPLADLSLYDGDGARPMPAKAILHQVHNQTGQKALLGLRGGWIPVLG